MTARVRIVLVEPREAGNIGAVTRVMKNFGLDDLVVIGSHPPLRASNALWWSSGAEDLLDSIRFCDSLYQGISDAHLTIATTSSRGRILNTPATPEGVALERSRLSEDQTLAIVFGREDHGLTSAEVGACHATAVIPTSDAFPTMNLAQSVAIFAYELSRERQSEEEKVDVVPHGLMERLHERAAALLLEVGYLDPKNPDRIYEELRALAARTRLTTRETSVMLALIRQIEWKIQTLAAE